MSVDYVIWDQKLGKHNVVLAGMQDVEDEWELNEGVPREAGFASPAVFHMDPERPHDTLLVDNVANIDFLVVASGRLTEFIRGRAPEKVEYLPATIFDHKGKPVGDPHFIIHPTQPVDCLDAERCGAKMDRLDPVFIKRLDRLVFTESFLESVDSGEFARLIFRPSNYYRITLVRRDLAEAIEEAGFTGSRWVEIKDYPRPSG